jgi:hypothetical protein
MLRPAFSEPMTIDPNGDRVAYSCAETGWLLDRAVDTAEQQSVKLFAAQGLMRALLETEENERLEDPELFVSSVNWTSGVLLDVLAARDPDTPAPDIETFLTTLPEVSGTLDHTTLHATFANIPEVSAAIIDRHIPKDSSKLVIGLGHGGIASALLTYKELGGDKTFYPVRFSRRKSHDQHPVLSVEEELYLRTLSESRTVIVHDEDWATGRTVEDAMMYFDDVLRTQSMGYVPVRSSMERTMHAAVYSRRAHLDGFRIEEYFGSRLRVVGEEAGLS